VPLLVAGVLGSLAWTEVPALSTDRDQPVNIESDWAQADDTKRVTVYKGKAIVVQGSIRITGDEVTMFFDGDHNMQELIAVGRLARFRQLPDGKKEYQRAKARRIEYYVDRNTMILIGDASLSQGKDNITADRIVYDTKNSRIKGEVLARKPASRKAGKKKPRSRVRILITPKKRCKDARGKKVPCPK